MTILARLMSAVLSLALMSGGAHATGILEAQVLKHYVETDRGDRISLEYSFDTEVVTFSIETTEASFSVDTHLMPGLEGPDLQRVLHYHDRDPDTDATLRMILVPFYSFGADKDVSVLLEFDDTGFRRMAVVREQNSEAVLREVDF